MKYKIDEIFKFLNYIPDQEDYKDTLAFFSEDRKCVRDQIEKLSWNEEEEVQNHAICYLAKELRPCEYIFLILPDKYSSEVIDGNIQYFKHGTDKSRWGNAAKTIIQIGWPRIDGIIAPLLFWLLDPNWPGSEPIREFILSLPKNVLQEKFDTVLNNPQNYSPYDYEDLKSVIEELQEDLA